MAPRHLFLFTSENGATRELAFSPWVVQELGGFERLGESPVALSLGKSGKTITSIRRADGPPALSPELHRSPVSGALPWITIPCKFSDVSAESRNLSYFAGMYDDTFPGLDHYWRELSYDNVNLEGSTAIDWVTLPHPRSHYVDGTGADLSALFTDCTAAADAQVDFSRGGSSPYVGINLAFNDDLDCCAWGGSRFAELDGVEKSWRTAWLPPWAYENVTVVAHEMGHGLGLPHSNNSDEDGWPYDNPWDVMSGNSSYNLTDAVFGILGQHTVSHHKDRLGWIQSGEIEEIHKNGTYAIELDHLAKSATPNHRMAWIRNRGDGTFYTVEVRDLEGYDGVPDKAVIIHHVAFSRAERAWIVDGDDPPADFADTEGVMWRVGETFSDPVRGVEVRVDGETPDGYQVTITTDQEGPLYAEDFESGDNLSFSSGYWHLTTACSAAHSGHSAPTALYYGLDSQCDYDAGGSSWGTAGFPILDLEGLSAPIELRFNYLLEAAAGSDFAAVYVAEIGGSSERVASNLGGAGEILLEDPSGTWRSASIDLSDKAGSEIRVYFDFFADATLNGYQGFFVDDVVLDACFAVDDLVLESVTVETSRLYEACNSITAGNGVQIASTGEAILRSAGRVVLSDGFSVASGGHLRVEIGSPQED